MDPYNNGIPNQGPGWNPYPSGMAGGGAMGGVLDSILPMLLSRFMGSSGMMPLGIGDTSAYSRHSAMRAFQMQQDLSMRMAQHDIPQYGQLLTRLGVDPTSAASMASGFAGLSPFLGSAIDGLGGDRGLAVSLARGMSASADFGRDPVTGARGMSHASMLAATERVWDQLYSGDNYKQMGGLRAGDAGQAWSEGQRRGWIRSDQYSRKDGESDANFTKNARAFNADRVTESIKDMAGVVTAMRGIFGDAGDPNAPVSKLLDGIQALTGNGVTSLNKTKAEGMARDMNMLAKSAGMSMQALFAASEQSQQQAAAMGLDPVFGARAAMSGMAAVASYEALGLGSRGGWGMGTSSQIANIEARKMLDGAGSGASNMIGAAQRLSEIGGGFGANTAAAKYLADVGRGVAAPMSQEAFIDMIVSSNPHISRSAVTTALTQRYDNQGGAVSADADRATRNGQRNELISLTAGSMRGAISGQLGLHGKDGNARAAKLSAAASQAMFGLTAEEMADPVKANAKMVAAMRASGAAGSASDEDLSIAAGVAWGQAQNIADQGGFGTTRNMLASNSQEFIQRQYVEREMASQKANMSKAMDSLGQGSITRRIVQAINEGKDWSSIALQAAGGVETGETIASLTEASGVKKKYEQIEQLREDWRNAKTPEERKKIRAEIDKQQAAYEGMLGTLDKNINSHLGKDAEKKKGYADPADEARAKDEAEGKASKDVVFNITKLVVNGEDLGKAQGAGDGAAAVPPAGKK